MKLSSLLCTVVLPFVSANLCSQIDESCPNMTEMGQLESCPSGREADVFNAVLYVSMDKQFGTSQQGGSQEARWNAFTMYPPALEALKALSHPLYDLYRNFSATLNGLFKKRKLDITTLLRLMMANALITRAYADSLTGVSVSDTISPEVCVRPFPVKPLEVATDTLNGYELFGSNLALGGYLRTLAVAAANYSAPESTFKYLVAPAFLLAITGLASERRNSGYNSAIGFLLRLLEKYISKGPTVEEIKNVYATNIKYHVLFALSESLKIKAADSNSEMRWYMERLRRDLATIKGIVEA